MKRTTFLLTGMVIGLLSLTGCQAPTPPESTHRETSSTPPSATPSPSVEPFTPLSNPQQWDASHPQEVVKIFSYLCIHCYEAEPAWKNLQIEQPHWQFVNVPVVGGGVLDTLAKIHYAAEVTGQLSTVAPLLYRAYHEDRETALKTGALTEWLDYIEQHGGNRSQLEAAMDSSEVQARLERSQRYTQTLGINRTPTFIAFGQYTVNFDTNWNTTLSHISSKAPPLPTSITPLSEGPSLPKLDDPKQNSHTPPET